MNNRFSKLYLAMLLLAAAATIPASGAESEPASFHSPVKALAEVALHRSPALDRESLAREDLDRSEQGLPFRFALPEVVSLTPDGAGTWETLAPGRSLWRLRVHCPEVSSLNLGFGRFWLPEKASLLVYPAQGGGPIQSYDEGDNADHGQLWTAVLLTDEVVVELVVDDSQRWQVELELTSIGRGYRLFGEDSAEKSGYCNIDVVCSEGDDWRDEIDSVGGYSYGGSLICTGFMVNNTARDGTPYFMTAEHCNVGAVQAPSLVVYWNFQSPECGDQGGGSLDDNQNGATLLAAYPASDMTLLRLDDVPDPSFGVKYAGWNRGGDVPTSAVCIHHPSGDEKSISFENDPLTVTTYQSNISPGDGTHLRVGDWDLGTTERGSSGSPLFDQNHHVVGQLHGGGAACGNNEPDWYGWFHVSWDGGGTPTSRLSNWLDPLGTGETTVETIDPFATGFTVTPLEGFNSSGVAGGTFEPTEMVYTLTNDGDQVAQFSAAVSVGWLTVAPESGSIATGGSVNVTVSLTEAVASLAAGTHQTILEIVNTAGGSGTTDRPVIVRVQDNVPQITGVVPNPFGSQEVPETQIRFTMGSSGTASGKIFNVMGRLVKDLGSMAAVAGENYFTWDGSDRLGRSASSGKYIFILNALGRELRAEIILIH
jgi:hypothetical protein